MDGNFDRALAEVLKHEGGFVNHPIDPGGATNKGITIAVYRKWVDKEGTVADLKKISDTTVAHIYRKHYWNAVRGDDLPPGLDYAVFDFAVNSGVSRASKFLQAILQITQDGKIGPATIAAANDGVSDALINQYCDRRLAFLKALRTWTTFGKGWSRRVADVRAVALRMVATDHDTVGTQNTIEVTYAAPERAEIASNWFARLVQLVAAFFKGLRK